MEKEKAYLLAEQMEALFIFISKIDVDSLREYEAILNKEVGNYEAIGIIDGLDYYKKIDDMKARYERLKSLINLIDTFNDTQNKII